MSELALQLIRDAENLQILHQALSLSVCEAGFGGYEIFSLDRPETSKRGRRRPQPLYQACFNGSQKPFTCRDPNTDPIVGTISARSAPFELISQLKAAHMDVQMDRRRQFLEEAGVTRAWAIPLHNATQFQGTVFYMCGAHDGGDVRFDTGLPPLQNAAIAALARAKALTFRVNGSEPSNDKNRLTDREIECVSWARDGKTNWEIGVILSISENTVRFHLKNAFRKLGVPSRGAAARALEQQYQQ